MKIRSDFVTNSSSSSFICCFARIADEEKAKKFLEQYKNEIEIYTAQEVLQEIQHYNKYYWDGWLDWSWAGIHMTPNKDYIQNHTNSRFVISKHSEDVWEDEDGYVDYDVDLSDFDTSIIDQITEENGFADIECQYGAGRDG